jgi:hypothetical protein
MYPVCFVNYVTSLYRIESYSPQRERGRVRVKRIFRLKKQCPDKSER